MVIAVLATFVLIFVLLPLALFKRNRHWCGTGVIYVSYAWGVALWMFATLALNFFWGPWGMILGFMLLGIGSVPLACVALLFAAKLKWVGGMLLGIVLVLGGIVFGEWLASGAELDLPEAVQLDSRPYRWGKFFASLSILECLVFIILAVVGVRHGVLKVILLCLLLAVLSAIQAWGLMAKRKSGLVAFYISCLVSIANTVFFYFSSPDFWRDPQSGLGAVILYVGSLPYFLKRRHEFGRN